MIKALKKELAGYTLKSKRKGGVSRDKENNGGEGNGGRVVELETEVEKRGCWQRVLEERVREMERQLEEKGREVETMKALPVKKEISNKPNKYKLEVKSLQ